MLKKTLASLTAVMMVLSATACTSGETASTTSSNAGDSSSQTSASETTGESSASGEPINLRMIWWGSQTRHEYTEAAIDVFEGKNPGVTISPEYVSWDGYWQKLATQSASKDLPDIIQMDYKYINQYAKNDLVIDMNPYVESGVLNLDDCPEANWSSGVIDGKLAGICNGINTICTLIDPDMLEAIGEEAPSLTWTWDDYEALCQKFIDNKDTLGIDYVDDAARTSNGTDDIAYNFRENDMWFYNQDGSESFAWTKEEGKPIIVEYLNREKEYADLGYTAPIALRDETQQNGVESQPIIRGMSAMASGIWSNQILAVSNAAGKKFVVTTLPAKTEARMQYMKPSQFFSVASNSQNPEMAVKFVDGVTNDVDMNMELKAERGVPISTAVQDALAATYEEDSVDKQIFDYVAAVSEIAGPIWVPEPQSSGAIITLTGNMIKDVVNNGVSPEDAFENFYSQAEVEFQMAQ